MKFDVSPSGMDAARGTANNQGDELGGDLAMLQAAVDSASGASGSGPLSGALESFAGGAAQASRGLTSRVRDTTTGAGNAVGAFVEGDEQMARHAERGRAQTDAVAGRVESFRGSARCPRG